MYYTVSPLILAPGLIEGRRIATPQDENGGWVKSDGLWTNDISQTFEFLGQE